MTQPYVRPACFASWTHCNRALEEGSGAVGANNSSTAGMLLEYLLLLLTSGIAFHYTRCIKGCLYLVQWIHWSIVDVGVFANSGMFPPMNVKHLKTSVLNQVPTNRGYSTYSMPSVCPYKMFLLTPIFLHLFPYLYCGSCLEWLLGISSYYLPIFSCFLHFSCSPPIYATCVVPYFVGMKLWYAKKRKVKCL